MSTLDETQKAVLGDIDECRMSLYGIYQLLKSRTVGAAQLTPALEGVHGMALQHCSAVDGFIVRLLNEVVADNPQQRQWRSLLEGIRAECAAMQKATIAAVAAHGHGKLGVKARLQLEQQVATLGVRLESLHDVAVGVVQSVRGRTRLCQLVDLFGPSSPTVGAFVPHKVELFMVDPEDPVRVVAEAWRLVLHQQLWWFVQRGVTALVVWRSRDGGVTLAPRSGPLDAPLSDVTMDHIKRPVRPASELESRVAVSLAEELGILVDQSEQGVMVRPLMVQRIRRPHVSPAC